MEYQLKILKIFQENTPVDDLRIAAFLWRPQYVNSYVIVPANEVRRGHRNGERPSVCLSWISNHYLEK